ncbi:MAG: CaiB/BaiF CoA transferase family protein [Tepidiformaceae bacterium]
MTATATAPATEPGVLTGVRVLELTHEAGQYAGKLLANLGADVIKIEPLAGDEVRHRPPFALEQPGVERSLLWWQLNSGKRSVALDVHTADGRAVLARLIATANVVLCSGSPRDLEALGAPFAEARAANPDLIVATITPYGWIGPKRDCPGTDVTAQAAGGIMSIAGFPDEPPMYIGGSLTAHETSIHAAVGVIMSIWGLRNGMTGQHVDVSMQQTHAATLQPDVLFWPYKKEVRRQKDWFANPFTWPLQALDGYVSITILPQRMADIGKWLDRHGMADDLTDPRYLDVPTYQASTPHVFEVVKAFAATQTMDQLADEGQHAGALVFPVLDASGVVHDKQFVARDWFVDVEQRAIGAKAKHPGAPFRLAHAGWRLDTGAPFLGEHTREVLTELDLGLNEQIALAGAGVIA